MNIFVLFTLGFSFIGNNCQLPNMFYDNPLFSGSAHKDERQGTSLLHRLGLGCHHFLNETSWNILNSRIYFIFNAAKGFLTLKKYSSIISLWFIKGNFSYDIQFIPEEFTAEIQKSFSLKITLSATSIPWWSEVQWKEEWDFKHIVDFQVSLRLKTFQMKLPGNPKKKSTKSAGKEL